METPSNRFFTTKKNDDGSYDYYITDEKGRATGAPMSEAQAIKTESLINKYLKESE